MATAAAGPSAANRHAGRAGLWYMHYPFDGLERNYPNRDIPLSVVLGKNEPKESCLTFRVGMEAFRLRKKTVQPEVVDVGSLEQRSWP